MRTIRTRTIACAIAMAALLGLAPLGAETTQPGAGVRSVGDVFK